MVQYFLKTVVDPEIKEVLEYTLNIARKHLQRIREIYIREKHPIPRGFTAEDVNLEAPRLFSDSVIISFLADLARSRLDGYSTALQTCARSDVRQYFTECVADPAEIYNRSVSVMLSKGIFARPPQIRVPEKIIFTTKQNFLSSRISKKKPFNSIHVTHIFFNLQRNHLRKSILTGFSQVAKEEQVRQYMLKGKEIAEKHIEIFSTLLLKNNFPVSLAWESGVTDSTIAPFSDLLMLQEVRSMNVILSANYAKAISISGDRKDLAGDFARLMAEILKHAREGMNLLVNNGWYEEPPQAEEPGAPLNTVH